jgi:hypothetical protein
MKFKNFITEKLNKRMVKESPDQWYVAEQALNNEEEKKTEDTQFKEGDIIILFDNKKSTKIPDDAWDFLTTYKEFKVIKVSETGKLDLGCHISKNTPEGGIEKIYLFSPKRFALKNASDKPRKN